MLLRPVRSSLPAAANRRSRSRFGSATACSPGQGEALQQGGEQLGQQHELQPDGVGGEVLVGQVAGPGVLRGADAVLAARPPAVPQVQAGVYQ